MAFNNFEIVHPYFTFEKLMLQKSWFYLYFGSRPKLAPQMFIEKLYHRFFLVFDQYKSFMTLFFLWKTDKYKKIKVQS